MPSVRCWPWNRKLVLLAVDEESQYHRDEDRQASCRAEAPVPRICDNFIINCSINTDSSSSGIAFEGRLDTRSSALRPVVMPAWICSAHCCSCVINCCRFRIILTPYSASCSSQISSIACIGWPGIRAFKQVVALQQHLLVLLRWMQITGMYLADLHVEKTPADARRPLDDLEIFRSEHHRRSEYRQFA